MIFKPETEADAGAEPAAVEPAAPPPLHLECALDPAEALRDLLRHPLLAPVLPKPLRWKPEAVTWLESPALGEEGLLEQRRREAPVPVRCVPPAGACLPGTLPEPEVEEGEVEAPPRALAAFVGRRVAFAAQGARVEILQGRIRAVAGEETALRVRISGPPEDAISLAARLAETVPLLPAAVPLAEAARAVALGTPPRQRRQGAPELGDAATVEAGFVAAATHLLDALLAETPRAKLALGPRGVHQSRVAIRRLRSVLKIFRPVLDGHALREWDASLGAVAKALGEARDWDVFQQDTAQRLRVALPKERSLARLTSAARARQEAGYAALAATLAGAPFRAAVWQGVAFAALRPYVGDLASDAPGSRFAREAALAASLRPFAAQVMQRRWRRMRKAGEGIAELAPEALHELRLDVKRLRYAAELFAPLWGGKVTDRLLRRLSRLQEALGVANDAEVARGLAGSLAGVPAFAAGAVAGFSAGRAEGSRSAALEEWERLLDIKRFWKNDVPAKPALDGTVGMDSGRKPR